MSEKTPETVMGQIENRPDKYSMQECASLIEHRMQYVLLRSFQAEDGNEHFFFKRPENFPSTPQLNSIIIENFYNTIWNYFGEKGYRVIKNSPKKRIGIYEGEELLFDISVTLDEEEFIMWTIRPKQ